MNARPVSSPDSAPLIHCIYASVAAASFEESQLPSLLEQSRRSNAASGVTGMLLYIAGSFFQVLEGAPDAVEAVLARIKRDPRHTHVTLIIEEPIAERHFIDWSMGFETLDPREAGTLLGENDFFGSADCVARLDPGRARMLLRAFRSGRWRLERTDLHRALG